MYELEFLKSAEGAQKVSDVLKKNIGQHDMWSKEGHQAELFAIDAVRHVGLNREGNIAGIVDVMATVTFAHPQGGPDLPTSITAYSCFVMTPDMAEVKDFGYMPGHSIIYPKPVFGL